MQELLNKKWIRFSLLASVCLLSLACYAGIAYYTPRILFVQFILLSGVCFTCYAVLVSNIFSELPVKSLIVFALIARLVFIVSLPQLSDDYFRFLWDGLLSTHHLNPFAFTPSEVPAVTGFRDSSFLNYLKQNMNSVNYFSVYPPVLQLVFFVSAKAGMTNVVNDLVVFRIMALLAEGGTVYIITKLLHHFNLPKKNVLLYALNPLVIIEFAGNLHGEVFMLFFLSLSIWLLVKNQLLWSAAALAFAAGTKLLPFIFLPLIIGHIGFKKGVVYSIILFVVFFTMFLPFADTTFIMNISNSLGLYFAKFEFNPSIYYLLLWIGYLITGVNIILVLGKILPIISLWLVLRISFKNRLDSEAPLMQKLLAVVFIYFLFSLVVHPWYITILVFLAVFTRFRFPILWSALVLLTYSAYTQVPYQQVYWLLVVEYLAVFAYLFYEIRKKKASLW